MSGLLAGSLLASVPTRTTLSPLALGLGGRHFVHAERSPVCTLTGFC